MRRAIDGVFIHLVWATWDREPLLRGEVRRIAYRAIGAKCAELGASVIALGGVADHVHLLVRLPLTLSVAQAVKEVKGSSGHLLARIASERGAFFKWQGAYGAFSVSYRDLDMISEYIRRQEEHHAQRSLNLDWELPPAEHATTRQDTGGRGAAGE